MSKVDLKGLKAIKFDSKTTIYVKQGVDENAIIEKYKNRKLDSRYDVLESYDRLGNKPLIRLRRAN